jgi:hypothetical protein
MPKDSQFFHLITIFGTISIYAPFTRDYLNIAGAGTASYFIVQNVRPASIKRRMVTFMPSSSRQLSSAISQQPSNRFGQLRCGFICFQVCRL